jgi:hypothetical protein
MRTMIQTVNRKLEERNQDPGIHSNLILSNITPLCHHLVVLAEAQIMTFGIIDIALDAIG